MASTAVFVSSEAVGRGSDDLGLTLTKSFFSTLAEQEDAGVTSILLMNSGVKLICEGSEVLETLDRLSRRGVEILACRTCLKFFDLTDKVACGTVSNMWEIQNRMLEAEKVITL